MWQRKTASKKFCKPEISTFSGGARIITVTLCGMIKRICLDDDWSLKEAPITYKKDMAGYILSDSKGWYEGISIPCDVHSPLIEAGVIKDPVLADYSFDSEWIEHRSWWFKKTFMMDDISDAYYRLILESLDVHADIFLNGAYLGHHAGAFYPFEADVKEFLVPGENVLLIRLTAGLEYVDEEALAEVGSKFGSDQGEKRGDNRRVYVRKPAYVFGWDWCPRAASVAIAKDVYIECCDGLVMNSAIVKTLEIKDKARICADIELEVLNPLDIIEADVTIGVFYKDEEISSVRLGDKLLCSGVNFLSQEFCIENPSLWWPNGMGEQPLYELRVSAEFGDGATSFKPVSFGIRTIELDVSKIDEQNRRFAFVVNGIQIFCKGANWVPADSVYARVTAEKYENLVKEAKDANFNMLRVWGGGLYERDEFYDACDKYGILVWQDFMFACASFPDSNAEFYDLVCKELDYQTKRLGSRACFALFCGNNEIHCNPQLFGTYGMKIFNIAAPQYVHKNCSNIPYWNSSPYPKTKYPYMGDDHFWDYINEDIPVRIEPKGYDKVPDKFVSEYGYVGPVAKESIEQYFDGKPIEMFGDIWMNHTNVWEKDTVSAGVKKHYTDKELTLDEYLLYAGLVQSLMYGYSLESFRTKPDNGGGLIWMFNDCWGETGWTIVDYYMRRKISYYGVKRALEPIKLIMRENGGTICVYGVNDTANEISFDMKYGYMSFDGVFDTGSEAFVTLKPFSRCKVLEFSAGNYDVLKGCYYAKPSYDISPAILRMCDYRTLDMVPAKVGILSQRDDGEDKLIEIASEVYCHAVHIDGADFCLSDNYFDMLPGEKRIIRVQKGAGNSFEIRTVN